MTWPEVEPVRGQFDSALGQLVEAQTTLGVQSQFRLLTCARAAGGGATLHQLLPSALTHLAEGGVPTVLLMAKSRHATLRTVQRHARPGVEAVARLTAEHDPDRR